jgi:kynurenine formamidase
MLEAASPRWTRRPPGSNWGDWGPDDQRGRLNLLTPAKVLQGIAEVREGRSFCLSLPLDLPGGNRLNERRHPPVLRPTIRNGQANVNYQLGQDNPALTDVMSDDAVLLHTQYSTQWDGLAHVGQLFDADGDGIPEPRYYNGYLAGKDVTGPTGTVAPGQQPEPSGARALGIEHMAETCVQGRGVMIDLHAHFGRKHHHVGYEDLRRVMDADGVSVEPGDMVCLHTGFAQMLVEMDGRPDAHALEHSCAVLDGRDQRLLDWIASSDLSVLIADNYAVEAHPAGGCDAPTHSAVPLHELCLFKLGIHLAELWHLTPLAAWLRAQGRSRFLLTAPPLRLRGAIGSPVTPVATV